VSASNQRAGLNTDAVGSFLVVRYLIYNHARQHQAKQRLGPHPNAMYPFIIPTYASVLRAACIAPSNFFLPEQHLFLLTVLPTWALQHVLEH
jgi:hypothetical protein